MRTRRARPEELDVIGAVTLAAYEPFLLGEDDFYRVRLADAAARDREAELWVATPDDSEEILGCVTICPAESSWREIAQPGEGEFRMLAVAPTAQGQGVGRVLTELVLDRLGEAGVTSVVLSSLDEMAAAHRLYARLGFHRVPDRDWSPAPDVALLAFRKEL